MKKFFLSIFFLSVMNISHGQTASTFLENQGTEDELSKLFPNIYTDPFNLKKIEEGEVNGYYGKPEISIPLYEINFDGMKIPISINYDASGIKVNEFAGTVGLGWTLNTGGEITKEINYIEDNKQKNWWHVDLGLNTTKYGYNWGSESYYDNDSEKDVPDIFKINFSGIQGSFLLNQNLEPTLLSKANNIDVKVVRDLDNLQDVEKYGYVMTGFPQPFCGKLDRTFYLMAQYMPDLNCNWQLRRETDIQKITISKDKFKYIFDKYDQDISVYSQEYISNEAIYAGVSDSYHKNYKIGSIVNKTNDKNIIFEYETFAGKNPYKMKNKTADFLPNYGDDSPNWGYTEVFSYVNNTFVNRLIKKITSDNEIITFYYSYDRLDNVFIDYEFNSTTHNQNKNYPLLSKIIIQDKISLKNLFKYDFSYDYFNSGCSDKVCKRLKLLSITKRFFDEIGSEVLGKDEIHSFDYYTDFNLPRIDSFNQDSFGFMGNLNSDNLDAAGYPNANVNMYKYSELIPESNYIIKYYSPLKVDNVNAIKIKGTIEMGIATLEKMRSWTLKSIIFPTKGKEEFIYEPNQFSWNNTIVVGNGLRIKKINLTDGNILKSTSYQYGLGTMLSLPFSNVKEFIDTSHSQTYNGLYRDAIPSQDTAGVFYKTSTKINSNNSKIVTEYNSVEEYPDVIPNVELRDFSHVPVTFNIILKKHYQPDYIGFNYLNNKNYRGTVKEITYLDDNSKIVSTQKNNYSVNTFPNTFSSGIFDLDLMTGSIFAPTFPVQFDVINYGIKIVGCPKLKYLAMPYLLNNNSTVGKEYFSNSSYVETKTDYFFNSINNLTSTNILTSDGSNTQISYQYAHERSNQKLIDSNMTGIPLITEIKKNGKTISKSETLYEDPVNLLPSSVLSYDFRTNNPNTELTYDKYDVKGNLLQYTTKSGVSTTIIWGYNQSQPIAKIEGAKLNEIPETTITDIMNESNEYSDLNLLPVLDALRVSFPKYQISTYTYKPLIGVSTITTPNGIREYYFYDTANRLQSVKDSNGNILKEYLYNYAKTKYYNSVLSQVFRKNNCNFNEIGNNFTYTVLANLYNSIISQADADQKAQNDIDSNGQNATNLNGTCTSSTGCTLTDYFNGHGSISFNYNNYKINASFSTGSSSTTLPWSTGVKIYTIQGNCKPLTEYNGYNGQVYYKVMTNGDIVLRKPNGVYPNNTNCNFEFFYPRN